MNLEDVKIREEIPKKRLIRMEMKLKGAPDLKVEVDD